MILFYYKLCIPIHKNAVPNEVKSEGRNGEKTLEETELSKKLMRAD